MGSSIHDWFFVAQRTSTKEELKTFSKKQSESQEKMRELFQLCAIVIVKQLIHFEYQSLQKAVSSLNLPKAIEIKILTKILIFKIQNQKLQMYREMLWYREMILFNEEPEPPKSYQMMTLQNICINKVSKTLIQRVEFYLDLGIKSLPFLDKPTTEDIETFQKAYEEDEYVDYFCKLDATQSIFKYM
jgi:hypothetical protein